MDQAVDWIEKTPVDGPIVLAGDFNAPITTSQRRYDEVMRRLTQMGLVDAYRVTRGIQDGESPTEGTYYHWRRHEMQFHIDHVVVPTEWADGAKVEIGDFETWVASGRSDHAPVVVDLEADRLG
ncbi:endonuclease/exonuclease/phosphatase family protein [Geodermatophilus sp. SYSU D01105]